MLAINMCVYILQYHSSIKVVYTIQSFMSLEQHDAEQLMAEF